MATQTVAQQRATAAQSDRTRRLQRWRARGVTGWLVEFLKYAVLVSLAVFALCAWVAVGAWGNHGLWAAMVVFVVARAAALLPYYRRLEAALD